MNFDNPLPQNRYGAIELKGIVGRNTFKGLGISILIHCLVLAAWALLSRIEFSHRQSASRLVVYSPIHVQPPPAKEQPRNGELGGERGGGGASEDKLKETTHTRYQLRSIVEDSPYAADYSLTMLDSRFEVTQRGEAEDPLIDVGGRVRTGDRLTRLTAGGGASDFEGFAGDDELGRGLGSGMSAGGGIGSGIGGHVGSGIGNRRGGGGTSGEGTDGYGSGRADGAGTDLGDESSLVAEARQLAKPADLSSQKPNVSVVNISKYRGAVAPPENWSPIIAWISKHQKGIPVTLQKPEILNQRPGDVTTWVEFDDEADAHYTLFLLGRQGHPPQLNIFLVTNGHGTLLQDEGAKGESEVYKFGGASGNPSNPTVQLELLPPGKSEAKRMMRVFVAWWNHIKNIEPL